MTTVTTTSPEFYTILGATLDHADLRTALSNPEITDEQFRSAVSPYVSRASEQDIADIKRNLAQVNRWANDERNFTKPRC